ncbi:95_t:CDS:2 [Ambispora gerdemannii]|uniref:95_t:CDS:1 n=1 Tax=Ambispora gerdemannii TaxID=144530 RepID=A0A9N8VIN7_9GLOM|nr:95_t:CDS:2 [Ambispora gerdemannii]
MSTGGFLAVAISLLALGVLVITFPKLGKVPPQAPSYRTGLPIWHTSTDIDQKTLDGHVRFSPATICDNIRVQWTNNTTNLPRKIASYFTLLAFDIGKLWETFGLFHNLCEVAILTLLNQGGKVTNVTRYILGLGTYLIGVDSIVLLKINKSREEAGEHLPLVSEGDGGSNEEGSKSILINHPQRLLLLK